MCLRLSYKKNMTKHCLCILEKGLGSGSFSQRRYGSADPDPHQNFTDPQQVGRRRFTCNAAVVAQHNHYLGQDTPHIRVLLPCTAKIMFCDL
jgi:hypothetical protein